MIKSVRKYKYEILAYYFSKPVIKNTKNVNIIQKKIIKDGYLGSDIIYVFKGILESKNKKLVDTYLKCILSLKTIVEIKRI